MRITVYDESSPSGRTMVGWFDQDRAEHFYPDPLSCREFGDAVAGSADGGQSLYRTCLGRWVLCEEQSLGRAAGYRFLSPAHAHTWLRRHGFDDAAAQFFGRKRKVGRPEVGGPVAVRLGAHLLTEVDNYAGARNVSRADAIRDLITTALAGAGSLGALPAGGDTPPGRAICC